MLLRNRKSGGRDGCGYLFLVCLATCLLLAANGVLFAMLYDWLRVQGAWVVRRPKLAQSLLFLGPVALIFAEWWLIDLVTGYRSLRRRPRDRDRDS